MTEIRWQYVRKMASKVLKDSKITEPPINLRVIAEAHGIVYREVEDFPDSVDALIIRGDDAIYAAVNARHHLHRQRFSLAHELGHFFLYGDADLSGGITIDNPPMEEAETASKDPAEAEADLFAGELLVPLAMLKLHAGKAIPELSKIFVVSEQVIAIAISKHMNALFK